MEYKCCHCETAKKRDDGRTNEYAIGEIVGAVPSTNGEIEYPRRRFAALRYGDYYLRPIICRYVKGKTKGNAVYTMMARCDKIN